MTVIFQLFSVDDIKSLGRDGPQRLLGFIRKALAEYKDQNAYGLMNAEEPAKFVLEASNETELTSKDETPPQVLDAIQKRFEEVSQQLMSPSTGDQPGSSQIDPSHQLFQQISDDYNRRRGTAEHGHDDYTILQWAISCEVNNFNFYYPLLQVKKKAYEWFLKETGKRPKGPDSPYSPFNPLHPLYHLFYNLEPESNPPAEQEDTTPTA